MYSLEVPRASISNIGKIATLVGLIFCGVQTSSATVVRFTSNVGTFDVRMYDTATPLTVANILNYVNDGDFDNSIIHRSENTFVQQQDGSFVDSPFVIQGGNSFFNSFGFLDFIPSDAAVLNEPGISNLRGTMALARVGGQINSGTNNWFVNLGNNSFLDTVDQGFTVFGRVLYDGMDVVDAIADMQTWTIRDAINRSVGSKVPIHGDISNGIARENFVEFTSVEVLNIPDGDADLDGDVDSHDFLIWQRSVGSTTDVAADFNGDAIVNAADLAIWESDYNAALQSAITSVPEPSSLVLLTLGFLILGKRCR